MGPDRTMRKSDDEHGRVREGGTSSGAAPRVPLSDGHVQPLPHRRFRRSRRAPRGRRPARARRNRHRRADDRRPCGGLLRACPRRPADRPDLRRPHRRLGPASGADEAVLVIRRPVHRRLSGPAHAQAPALPIDARHFDHWLEIFVATANDLCPPVASAHFIERARRIAESLELGVANANNVLLAKGERYTRPFEGWTPE